MVTVKLIPLTPEYLEERHSVYFEHLQDILAVEEPTGVKRWLHRVHPSKSTKSEWSLVRNIALAGNFGVGKSSVLDKVQQTFAKRTLRISFAALLAEPPMQEQSTALPLSSRMQKEIVKQLIYGVPASKLPASRLNRIRTFSKTRAIATSLAVAAALTGGLWLLGIPARLQGPDELSNYGELVVGLAVVLYILQWRFQKLPRITAFTAGAATVNLAHDRADYFDAYLDEIDYFFNKTGIDIVIFEDLDRHEEPSIYQSLRSLNLLLNQGARRNVKPIRFIYAVRDSHIVGDATKVCDKCGVASTPIGAGPTRTKFFDLVIPMVPFITHSTARDLLKQLMADTALTFDEDLMRIIGRNVSDMRVLKNMRNEFTVFQELLHSGAGAALRRDPNRLLAMLAIKITQPAEFEAMQTRSSKLDDLYALSRQLQRAEVARIDAEIVAVYRRSDIFSQAQAVELGQKLRPALEMALAVSTQRGLSQVQVGNASTQQAFEASELMTPAFWRAMANSTNVSIMSEGGPSRSVSRDQVEAVIGDSLDASEWEVSDAEQLRSHIAMLERELAAVRGADLAYLWNAHLPGGSQMSGDGRQLETLQAKAKELRLDQLTSELIANGFVNHDYALYVGTYYDQTLSAKAMNFVLQCVEPNLSDALFDVGSSVDVKRLLDESEVLLPGSRSVLNVAIADTLLEGHVSGVDVLRESLSGFDSIALEFIDTYLLHGLHAARLTQMLTPLWPGVFDLLVSTSTLPEDLRLTLVDTALQAAASETPYTATPDVRTYLASHVARLPSLSGDSTEVVTRVVFTLGVLGVNVGDASGLPMASIQALADGDRLAMTEANVNLLVDAKSRHLEAVLSGADASCEWLIRRLDAYVRLAIAKRWELLTDDTMFTDTLRRLITGAPEVLDEVLDYAPSHLLLEDIELIDGEHWASLLRSAHMKPTVSNVIKYVADAETIDVHLAKWLEGRTLVADVEDEDARHQLALRILRSRDSIVDGAAQVAFVDSLNLGDYIDLTEVPVQSGDPVALLLERGIVKDSAETFLALVDTDWATREAAIAASARFSTFVDATMLPKPDLTRFLNSEAIPATTRSTVILSLLTLYPDLARGELEVAVRAALGMNASVPLNVIKLLAAGEGEAGLWLPALRLAEPAPTFDEILLMLTQSGQATNVEGDKWNVVVGEDLGFEPANPTGTFFKYWGFDPVTKTVTFRLRP